MWILAERDNKNKIVKRVVKVMKKSAKFKKNI